MIHDEADGPPVARDICWVCEGQPKRPKIKTKTAGQMLLERVAGRHKSATGASVIKMTKAAREDLIDEINIVIGQK